MHRPEFSIDKAREDIQKILNLSIAEQENIYNQHVSKHEDCYASMGELLNQELKEVDINIPEGFLERAKDTFTQSDGYTTEFNKDSLGNLKVKITGDLSKNREFKTAFAQYISEVQNYHFKMVSHLEYILKK